MSINHAVRESVTGLRINQLGQSTENKQTRQSYQSVNQLTQ